MKKIVVTGAEGFIGLHARFFLHEKEAANEVIVAPLNHTQFEDDEALAAALTDASAVMHFAGINRGTDAELEQGNIAIAERLVRACEERGAAPHILFSSSLHEDSDTPYGRGKKGAATRIEAFGRTYGSPVTIAVIPHVFGEFAKPHYNSAVATFVYELAEGVPSKVHAGGKVELVYVREAVRQLYSALEQCTTGRLKIRGEERIIADVYALLAAFADAYRRGEQCAVASPLELALFNTLQSAFFSKVFPLALIPHADERGALYEIVRSSRTDQVFYSTTKPGKLRGSHYHTHKMERFCVIGGTGEIALRRLLDDKIMKFLVSGDKPVVIDMPTYYTHHLKNVGDTDLTTVFWISEQYNQADPDTYREAVY